MEFMDLLYPYEFIPHPAILLMHLTISAGWYFCEVLIAGERRCQLILPTASEVKSYSIFYACRGLRGELSSLWRPSTCPESRGHVAIWTPNKNKWYWYIYIYWYLISFHISALQSITINNRCLWWCGFGWGGNPWIPWWSHVKNDWTPIIMSFFFCTDLNECSF